MPFLNRHPLLSCGNCEFARGRHADPEQAARAEAAGTPIPRLHCLRNPLPIAKAPDECCGDHSELILRRHLDLADMIALAIVKQQRVQRFDDNKGP